MTDWDRDPRAGVDLGGYEDGDGYDGEYADYVDLPPERSTLRKALLVLAGLAAVAVLVLAVGGWWLFKQIEPGGAGAEVAVVVPPGSTTSQIAGQLESEGVIANAMVFEYYARWKGAGPFEAGRYDGLRESSSMAVVVDRLEAGPLPPDVTALPVPEGLWLADIRERILATFPEMDPAELDTALGVVRSRHQPAGVAGLEGLLFPATYDVVEADRSDEQKLVRQMVAKFDAIAAEVGLERATEQLRGVAGNREITPFEAVVVASMIEKETSVPEEKAKIARVIYNRLAKGERLGIDATVLYALGEHKEQLTQSDLNVDSPYNTRRYPGIPPGPIGAPGRDSLAAALDPEPGPWLYYVLTDTDGSHFFTDDYQEFLRAGQDARNRGVF